MERGAAKSLLETIRDEYPDLVELGSAEIDSTGAKKSVVFKLDVGLHKRVQILAEQLGPRKFSVVLRKAVEIGIKEMEREKL